LTTVLSCHSTDDELIQQFAGCMLSETEQDGEASKASIRRVSKAARKIVRYERKLASYQSKKDTKKAERLMAKETQPEKVYEAPSIDPKDNVILPNKREFKRLRNERIQAAYDDPSNLKVCIDCSFNHLMSDKELSRLAQQIGRCYAANKASSAPVQLILCHLDKTSAFYAELQRVNFGFASYTLKTLEGPVESSVADEASICYLSPDAEQLLETVDASKTYVIGGLVDETVSKQVTLRKCKQLQMNSFKLPIEHYMDRVACKSEGGVYNYSKILAINQVFDILCSVFTDNDWPRALHSSVPRRKGFCIDQNKL